TRWPTRTCGWSWAFRVAHTRSRWTATGPCWRREPSTTWRSSRASLRRASGAVRERWRVAEVDRGGRALDGIAGNTSRRGFLARLSGALMAATAGGVVGKAIEPGEADAYHFCGHIYTTGSCPHPTGLPRIDSKGFPL